MTGNRVLLVDDEAVLAELLRKYLARHGFDVVACTDPKEALHLVEAEPRRFWLVISDMTLPGMPGNELIERIRALNPAIHAIIASGYPYQPPKPDVQFLQKPFLPKMLLQTIQRLPGAQRATEAGAIERGAAAGGTAENR
jgi:CheY-like chemotaxis protein